ncbi:Mu transposase C-terminal domain-containing protein [Paraburkholderia sp. J10-1]|uniref:Mu transposase C-terminal domain-containing protein n=1 Tax=Paraburkholderia sp. J10-1 TaxID=2805430 RepID=UPI002AB6BCCB|nr:Mu transposase C-terminal domain-containing protein [Paraburkholderia sp. J10-1]
MIDDTAWTINLNDKNCWPVARKYSELLELARKGLIFSIKINIRGKLQFCTPAASARRDFALKAIESLLSSPAIYDPVQRGRLVREQAVASGCCKTTIYTYLRAYWTGGQTKDALCFDFPSIGTSKNDCTNGRGRTTDRYDTYQMNLQDVRNIKKSIFKHFLKKETKTLASTHSWMLDRYYSYKDGNGKLYNKPLGERPTIHQFRQTVKKHFSPEFLLLKRKGEKDFNRDHNQHLTGALHSTIGAGHIYEIDATIADVWLVARDNPQKIIGKPTLYLIYDRYSRLCVGHYVGLENACWECAMQAILSIAEDKEALCKKYKLDYDPSDYPADGVFPLNWLGDRGEMISRNSNRICDGMEGSISNASSLCPQTKGTVECGFKLIHVRIEAVAPGYDPPINAKRRRGKHYESDACLNVDQFTALVILAINQHNRSMMKNYEAAPAVMLRTRPIPIELWNDSIINQVGSLRQYCEDYLHLKLLPRSSATIQKEGIFFKHCYYSCPEIERKGWFIAAANRGRSQVSVSFDRRLVDEIVVYDPNDHQIAYKCRLTPRSLHFKGLSFSEVDYIFKKVKSIINDDEEDAQQRRSDFSRNSAVITEPAYAAMKSACRGKSRSSRKARTALERATERTARRQTDAAMPTIPIDNRLAQEHEQPKPANQGDGISPDDQSNVSTANGENSQASSSTLPGCDSAGKSDTEPSGIEYQLALKRQEMNREHIS